MKKILLSVIAAALALPTLAANVLVLTPKSGQPVSFELAYTPTLTFSGTKVVVACNNQQLSYERSEVRSFQFADELPTYINNVNVDTTEPITVYAPDGRVVLRLSASKPLNLEQLGSGMFIVRHGANTYKVVNK